jgi:hypothetical protein
MSTVFKSKLQRIFVPKREREREREEMIGLKEAA